MSSDDAPSPVVRVMLVDDHAVVREGYRRLLELQADVQVVAEFGAADAACDRLAAQADVHVVVLDLSMPGLSGFQALRRMREMAPATQVLVFTMHDSPAIAEQALRAGAAGFVTKSSAPDVLVAAVRRVAAGERAVLSDDIAPARAPGAAALAPREFEVLQLLLQGLGVDEIGRRLDLSAKTVSNYQTAIRQKLGATTAIDLLHAARRLGLAAA